jgi:hypothetical protein
MKICFCDRYRRDIKKSTTLSQGSGLEIKIFNSIKQK